MKNFILSVCLCLATGLAIGGIQTGSPTINWIDVNQFEYLNHNGKHETLIKFDAQQGTAKFLVAGKLVKQHGFTPAASLFSNHQQQGLKFPYYNVAESGIVLNNACGGKRSAFDRTMAVYVNALRNGASQATLDAMAAAVWDAFSEWMFCMIR